MYTGLMAETLEQKYASAGHPSIEELKRAQGTTPTSDPSELLGDFWPEDEKIDDFLTVLREWRGHTKTDRAA
jgi:hypothetical protein